MLRLPLQSNIVRHFIDRELFGHRTVGMNFLIWQALCSIDTVCKVCIFDS